MSSENNMALSTGISLRTAALTAGLGLLIMAVLAPFANFYALQSLIVSGDGAATVSNITASEGLFRAGIAGLLIVAILDVVVAWALYVVFFPVNRNLSLLTAWLRVVYAAVFSVALFSLMTVPHLVSGADYLSVFEQTQLHAQVLLSLNAFTSGWDIGLAIFGLHLLLLGYLVFTSGLFPRFLGILVILAAAGYLVDSFGKIFFSGYDLTISLFTFIGEVLLIFWLLWRGVKGFT